MWTRERIWYQVCSSRSSSFDTSDGFRFRYCVGLLTNVGRNVSPNLNIRESTPVLRGHSAYHCPDMSWWSLGACNTHKIFASYDLCTLHAPDTPCEVKHFANIFSFVWSSTVHVRSMRCEFPCCVWTNGLLLVSVDSNLLLIVQGFTIWKCQCTASLCTTSSLVQTACIKPFTAEYSASVMWFSISVSSCGSLGGPEKCHIVW